MGVGRIVPAAADHDDRQRSVWTWPLHPLLFSALPVITILAQNTLEVAPVDVWRPLLLSMAAALFVWLLCWLAVRQLVFSAMVTSVLVLLFHTYGHLYSGHVQGLLAPAVGALGLVGSVGRAAWFTAALAGLATLAIYRLRRFQAGITAVFNIAAASLLVVAIATVAISEWKLRAQPPGGGAPMDSVPGSRPAQRTAPMDVYYVILDGYGRQDVLDDIYGFDDEPFLAALRDMGFEINPSARANYMQTGLSLSSSLNAAYLDDLLTESERGGPDRLPLSRLLLHNQVEQVFERAGYTTVAIESGYRPTELVASDQYLRPRVGSTSLLERLLIENSGLAAMQTLPGVPPDLRMPGYELHRAHVRYGAAALAGQAAATPSPKFVFAHLLVPHPPFVFDRDGSPRQPNYPYVLLDGSAFPGDQATYRESYRRQLGYTNDLILNALRAMVSGPAQGAIVIVQSDHGPGSRLDWQSYENTDLRERLANLLAIRLPPGASLGLQRVDTPVNLFRAVFNYLFDSGLPMLPDRSYYSTWDRPYDFQLVPVDAINPEQRAARATRWVLEPGETEAVDPAR